MRPGGDRTEAGGSTLRPGGLAQRPRGPALRLGDPALRSGGPALHPGVPRAHGKPLSTVEVLLLSQRAPAFSPCATPHPWGPIPEARVGTCPCHLPSSAPIPTAQERGEGQPVRQRGQCRGCPWSPSSMGCGAPTFLLWAPMVLTAPRRRTRHRSAICYLLPPMCSRGEWVASPQGSAGVSLGVQSPNLCLVSFLP